MADRRSFRELGHLQKPDWLEDWAYDNKGESMLLNLLFMQDWKVTRYFNKRYPEDIKHYKENKNDFKKFDFIEEEWKSYFQISQEDDDG